MSLLKLSFFDISQVETTPLIKMERYTLKQHIEIIKIHYKSGENLAETVRKTRTFLGYREAPCRTAIQKLVQKFELLGQFNDVKNKTRARRSRTAENIAVVAERVEENPGLSSSRRHLQGGASISGSLHGINSGSLMIPPAPLPPTSVPPPPHICIAGVDGISSGILINDDDGLDDEDELDLDNMQHEIFINDVRFDDDENHLEQMHHLETV